MFTRAGAFSSIANSRGAILAARVPTAMLLWAVRPGTGVSDVGGRASIRSRRRGLTSPRDAVDHEPPPGERKEEGDLRAKRLRPSSPELAGGAARERRQRNRRALGPREAGELAALDRRNAVAERISRIVVNWISRQQSTK